jgi:CRP/FNR family transcriptional regulator, cyclic AMP receptor protein
MSNLVDHLASVPLFSGCSADELQRLARVVDEVTVPAGTKLTVEGDLGREAFVIVDGTATVSKQGNEVALLGPGDHVGELALLDGGPRSATVTTTSDTTVLVMSKPAFNGVLDEIPALAHRLLVSVARRLRESEQSLGH